MQLLRRRVRGDVLPVEWMERWYAPSRELIVEKYRRDVEARIGAYLQPMTPDDEAVVRGWDMAEMLESDRYRVLSGELGDALTRHGTSRRPARV